MDFIKLVFLICLFGGLSFAEDTLLDSLKKVEEGVSLFEKKLLVVGDPQLMGDKRVKVGQDFVNKDIRFGKVGTANNDDINKIVAVEMRKKYPHDNNKFEATVYLLEENQLIPLSTSQLNSNGKRLIGRSNALELNMDLESIVKDNKKMVCGSKLAIPSSAVEIFNVEAKNKIREHKERIKNFRKVRKATSDVSAYVSEDAELKKEILELERAASASYFEKYYFDYCAKSIIVGNKVIGVYMFQNKTDTIVVSKPSSDKSSKVEGTN